MSDNILPFDRSWWRLDKILTGRERLRRAHGAPSWLEKEFAAGEAYPRSTGEIAPGIEVRYRRTGWRKVGDQSEFFRAYAGEAPEYRPRLTERETIGWLFVKGERLGAVQFSELDLRNLYNAELYELMDMEDSDKEELATALLHWPQVQTDLGDYGNVLHLYGVWQSPRLAGTRMGEAALLSFLWPTFEKSSILILKAFPFEYGGLVPEGAKTAIGFGRRQQAFRRLLERRLGVMRLPGELGEDGWMWRPSPRLKAVMTMPTNEPHFREDD